MEDKKKRVLLVGEAPESYTGNGNMMLSCMDEVDIERYDICSFLVNNIPVDLMPDPFVTASRIPFPTVHAYESGMNDQWGKNKLLDFLTTHDIDILVFVGVDIWRYAEIFDVIKKIQHHKNFTWKVLIPYDLDHIRNDWIEWMKYPDQVFVYSEFGYNMLKEHITNLYYFRPKFVYHEAFTPATEEEKLKLRHSMFTDISDETVIFGFVGVNQLRKNILNLVAGFKKVLEQRNDALLYLHLNSSASGVNIDRLYKDFDIPEGCIRTNANMIRKLYPHEMTKIYKVMDCHILPSFQEGLSWTVIEAKLTGTPSIISDTTAHKDYMQENEDTEHYGIISIPAIDRSYLGVTTEFGHGSPVPVPSCSPGAIKTAMLKYLNLSKETKELMSINARTTGVDWIENCSHFTNDLLDVDVQQMKNSGEIL